MSKKWYQSKTVWFNLITLVVFVIAAVLNVVETKAAVIILTVINAIGNGILRIWFTDTAIAKTPTT